MEFPGDIWIEIMSYFHSAYKVPLHYTSLVENKQFYFSREKNKRGTCRCRLSYLPQRRYISEMEKVYDSFYMTAILCSRNTTNKKESSFQIKRKTAHPDIIDDFITIFDEYKNPNLQILANIKY